MDIRKTVREGNLCDGVGRSPKARIDDLTPPEGSLSVGAGVCDTCGTTYWLTAQGTVPPHAKVAVVAS